MWLILVMRLMVKPLQSLRIPYPILFRERMAQFGSLQTPIPMQKNCMLLKILAVLFIEQIITPPIHRMLQPQHQVHLKTVTMAQVVQMRKQAFLQVQNLIPFLTFPQALMTFGYAGATIAALLIFQMLPSTIYLAQLPTQERTKPSARKKQPL